MTANSFTSVSLDPMLILVCVDQRAKILPLLQKKKRFGVSVLKAGQQAVSEYFCSRRAQRRSRRALSIRYSRNRSGLPVLEDTLLQLSCSTVAAHPAGDHTIFIAEVHDAEISRGRAAALFPRRIPQHRPPG